MGGTAHGKHSIVINFGGGGDYNLQHRYCAAALFKAFEQLRTSGLCTGVASYTNGSGGGFPGQPDEIGQNGFFVYRWPLSSLRTNWFWEILIEWHAIYQWSATGVNWTPATLYGGNGGASLGFGFQIAVGFDSGNGAASSWTGTTNFNWSDYKGATLGVVEPVWGVSGGTVHVFPSDNTTGNPNGTNKQNVGDWINPIDYTWDDNPKRFHVIADADSLYLGCDYENDGSVGNWVVVSPYTPAQGVTVAPPNAPLAVFSIVNGTDLQYDTSFGYDRGGVIAPNPGKVVTLYLPSFGRCLGPDTYWNPNNQRDTPTLFDEAAPLVGVNLPPYNGILGRLWTDFLRASWGIPQNSTFDSYARVVLGQTQNSYKFSFPWDGVTADPNGASDENGINF